MLLYVFLGSLFSISATVGVAGSGEVIGTSGFIRPQGRWEMLFISFNSSLNRMRSMSSRKCLTKRRMKTMPVVRMTLRGIYISKHGRYGEGKRSTG